MSLEKSQPGKSIESKEDAPKFGDLIIFTSTLHRVTDEVTKARSALVEKFLGNAENLNIKCVVMDSGSDPEFVEKLRSFKNVELLTSSDLSMGEQRRQALAAAMSHPEAKYFLWSEPEKDDLIREDSMTSLIEGLREDKTDIAVAARESKESYPEFQQWTEERLNTRADKLLPPDVDAKLDWAFAPKMFNREGAQFFLDYNKDKSQLDQWDAIMKPVLEAAKAGKRISSVEVDYTYDPSQRDAEEGNREMKKKRVTQYAKILAELGDDFWVQKLKK